jgi:hypothetical protein
MHRLENACRGERALVLLGGPSVLAADLDVGRVAAKGFVTFLEARALSPRLIEWSLKPDFYMMFYPEKSKANSFQAMIVNSMMAGFDIGPLVAHACQDEVRHLQTQHDALFTQGPINLTHKRLLWRPDVYLPKSPFALLDQLPAMKLIAYRQALEKAIDRQKFRQDLFTYDLASDADGFSVERYFAPRIRDGRLVVELSQFSNSVAIALYPILKFLGFTKVYLLGADQSLLGSMEFAAPYTFRSMTHFRTYYDRARRSFGTHFPASDRADAAEDIQARWRSDGLGALGHAPFWDSCRAYVRGRAPFIRPRVEMRDAAALLRAAKGIEFINVHVPYRYSRPAQGIANISFAELLRA